MIISFAGGVERKTELFVEQNVFVGVAIKPPPLLSILVHCTQLIRQMQLILRKYIVFERFIYKSGLIN